MCDIFADAHWHHLCTHIRPSVDNINRGSLRTPFRMNPMVTALTTILLLLSSLTPVHAQAPVAIDVSSTYRLTNNYTGLGLSFAARSDNSGLLEMATTADSPLQYWKFVLLQTNPQYALRNVHYGDSLSLDVINDQGINSTSVHLSATGAYSGQYWMIIPWGDGTYYFTNTFTGTTKHLDAFSDTLQPTLGTGDHTGQHWTIAVITNSTTGSPTTSVLTSSGSVPTVTSTTSTTASSGLSKGADIGVGLGAGIVGIALVGAGLWICWKRQRNPRENDGMETTRHHERETVTPSARLEPEPKEEARVGLRYPDAPTETTGGRTYNESNREY